MSNEDSLILRFVLFLGCLGGSSFFALCESAIFSLQPKQIAAIQSKHPQAGSLISKLLNRPRRLLLSLLLGKGILTIAAVMQATLGIYGFCAAYNLFDPADRWKITTQIVMFAITPILFLFGELMPKRIAIAHAQIVSIWLIRPIQMFYVLIAPLRIAVHWVSERLIKLLGGKEMSAQIAVQEARIRCLMDPEEEHFAPVEQVLLHRIFALKETHVSEIMTPRTDLFALSVDLPLDQIIEEVRNDGRSRVPIYQVSIDNIIGILYIKDVLKISLSVKQGEKISIHKILRQPYFVPGSKKANALLHEFQTMKQHFAVVVDEFGGTAGIITMEDILEEVFGEIHDELDIPEPLHQKIGPGQYVISAKLPIETFNEILHADVSDADFDTMGGFVFNLFGKLPRIGEKILHDRFHFTIKQIQGTRLQEILVETIEPSSVETENASVEILNSSTTE